MSDREMPHVYDGKRRAWHEELPEQEAYADAYGWRWTWRDRRNIRQGFVIRRVTTLKGRGAVLAVRSRLSPHLEIQVFLSEGGRSLKVHQNGKRLVEEVTNDE